MANNDIPRVVADFETQLSTAIAIGATSFTIASVVDDDGVTLPNGLWGFTVDNGSSNKEYYVGTLDNTTGVVSSVKTVTRQGTESSGSARAHRVGAPVIITDHMTLQRATGVLRGVLALDADAPLIYDADPTINDDKQLATKKYTDDYVESLDAQNVKLTGSQTVAGNKRFTGNTQFDEIAVYDAHPTFTSDVQIVDKKYVDDVAIAGSPNASTTVKGIVEEATQAETIAGTATGGTGARLFANPSQLLPFLNDKITIETTSGTTHSLTTTANQRVIVFAKGNLNPGGGANGGDATLAYNAVTKDTVSYGTSGGSSSTRFPFTLMYTETPGAATQNITLATSTGSVSNGLIVVIKIG